MFSGTGRRSMASPGSSLGTVEDKWSAIRSALVESAEEGLGHEERYQPDWFQESAGFLEPFFHTPTGLAVEEIVASHP